MSCVLPRHLPWPVSRDRKKRLEPLEPIRFPGSFRLGISRSGQYRKAAEQGNALAQYFLGVCCYDGQGVKQDSAEAEKWWRKAADQGYEPAKQALVKMETKEP